MSDQGGIANEEDRRRLASERWSMTHQFELDGQDVFIIVSLSPEGTPAEVFLFIAKEGSTLSGLMATVSILTSILLQYGVPLESFVKKFAHVRFEPSGPTSNPEIPEAKSLVDYIFRWLAGKFYDRDAQASELDALVTLHAAWQAPGRPHVRDYHRLNGDGEAAAPAVRPTRRPLPPTRSSITHEFAVAGHQGYITVSTYEDGTPGEVFLKMAKGGSTVSGMMDSIAVLISWALQYGVPLGLLVDRCAHMRFEPSGYSRNPEIPIAKSIIDYVFRWLAATFFDEAGKQAAGVIVHDPAPG